MSTVVFLSESGVMHDHARMTSNIKKLTIQIIAGFLAVFTRTNTVGGVVVVSMDVDTAICPVGWIKWHSLLETFVKVMEFRVGDCFIGNL